MDGGAADDLARRDAQRSGKSASTLTGVSVQTWFSSGEMVAQPGAQLTLPLSIQNLRQSAESYTVVPAGLSASWTAIERSSITLFGGSQDVVDVVVTPPEVPTTSAGPTVIAVRVIPLSEPDDTVVAEIVLAIQPSRDVRVHGREPRQ
jgi:hypothetical protein